jgi:hypothetical protein
MYAHMHIFGYLCWAFTLIISFFLPTFATALRLQGDSLGMESRVANNVCPRTHGRKNSDEQFQLDGPVSGIQIQSANLPILQNFWWLLSESLVRHTHTPLNLAITGIDHTP